MNKPLIGITTAIRPVERAGIGAKFYFAYVANALAIERAGGLPIMFPSDLQAENLRELYERVDAILLPGGGDVDPINYQAERHPETGSTDLIRDSAEITIARWAAEDDRPLFGICRGHQVVNVALGGTLIQDIPTQVQTEYNHNFPPDMSRDTLSHAVNIEPGSVLAGIVGSQQIKVNSLHHQSVDQAASDLKITAYAPDGVVEAAELPGKFFYHSVQWHPEDLTHLPQMQALFDALVNAARQRM